MNNPGLNLLPVLMLALSLLGCATPGDQASERNTALIHRYFDQWANQGDPVVADSVIATNLVLRNPPAVLHSLAEHKESVTRFHAAFPDLHFTVEDTMAQGDRVMVRWSVRATHLAEYQGRPPTRKQMNITGVSLFRISEGKIQEIWVNMDRRGMMEQLEWREASPKTSK